MKKKPLQHTIMKALFVFSLIAFLNACGGGGSSSNNDSASIGSGGGQPATVTISGIATDDPVSGATVQLQTLDGNTIETATTDSTGAFSTQTSAGNINPGYMIVVTGGQVGGVDFPGELRAQYAKSDDRHAANVTLMTTLIARIAAQETSGTPLEKRDAVIARLAGMGVVSQDDWSGITPTGVSLSNLRKDISIRGLDPVLNTVSTDLQDGNVNADDMSYFPRAHGGIVRLAMGDTSNRISVFPGASGKTSVGLQSVDQNASYTYALVSGPDWLSVDPQSGSISYTVPGDATPSSLIPFSIKATNNATGFSRTVAGQVYIMTANPVAQGSVDAQGGRIINNTGDIAVDVPAGAVSTTTQITVTTGRDTAGNVVIRVNSDTNGAAARTGASTTQPYTLHLPDPDVLDANTPASSATQSQPRSVQPQSAIPRNVAPEFGSADCVKEGENSPTISKCWLAKKRYFSTLYDPLTNFISEARVPNDKSQIQCTLFQPCFARIEVASELWSSLSAADASVSDEEPVLFIHGYNANALALRNQLGGGKGTWEDFETLLSNVNLGGAKYIPFEFRWNSNARFQDMADDLVTVINIINAKTGKKVHIIAHSFGGVLARTLLQHLASSGNSVGSLVASLTTVGTPHSGIYQTEPKGSDNLTITQCAQISCYQTGLDEISPSILSRHNFELKDNAGYITDKLKATTDNLPDIPVQVLIGLTTDAGFNSIVDNGDGLISFAGQRFTSDLTLLNNGTATYEGLLSNAAYGQAAVSEHILGFTVSTKPGDDISSQNVPEKYKYGYRHTGGSTAALFRGSAGEVAIVCSNDTDCQHDTWLKVKTFLQGTTAANASFPVFRVTGIVKNASGTGIAGVHLTFSSNRVAGGDALTDQNGNFSADLPFYPSTTYHLNAIPPSGYLAATSTGTVTTGATASQTQGQFPPVTLTSSTVSVGSLGGIIKDSLTGLPLNAASFTVINSTGLNMGSGTTAADGTYLLNNLPEGMYRLDVTANGYTDASTTCYVSALASNACSLTLSSILSSSGSMRIVLEWDVDPRDLDSHLVKYDAAGNQLYHIYFGSKTDSNSGDNLDVDDVTSYGPETVTIQSVDPSARYVYAVHHFSGSGSLTTTSQARVTVTYGAAASATFNVPTSGSGSDWKVFEINNGVVQPCQSNCMFNDTTSAVRSVVGALKPQWLKDILETMPAK